jgi:glutathione S-transferase
MSGPTLVLYGTPLSGHCHRVVLLLSMLGLPHRVVEAAAPMRRSPEFQRLNPLGQIPVLEDGAVVIADSNAILVYLAKRYGSGNAWLPEDPLGAARVQRWLSVAAGEVRYGPAAARMSVLWGVPGDRDRALEISERVLRFMEGHCAEHPYLAAEHATIADLACYSYVAHAPEGGVPLEPYGQVRSWLRRIEALPGFVPMPSSPIPQQPAPARG